MSASRSWKNGTSLDHMTTGQPLVMTSTDEHQFLTPDAAAKRAGVSRPTINRALKTRELQAHRDNRNRWQIAAADLDAWADARRTGQPDQIMTTGHDQRRDQLEQARSDLAAAREDLAAARATVSQLQSRLDAAEQDRDRWRSVAEKLADRSPVTPPPAPRRRWWSWGWR